MWIFLPCGFFSIVRKDPGDTLTIRARVRADLERLRQQYLPELSPILDHVGSDYPYRATATRAQLRVALARFVDGLDYANFKSEVDRTLGSAREHLYADVWKVMRGAEETEPAKTRRPQPETRHATPSRSSGKKRAYGGVVVNDRSEVLLRKPKGDFDGYVWTWPKGRAEHGEAPEEAALRETREETGVETEIIREIPGDFVGHSTVTRFWLMRLVRTVGAPDRNETESVRWVRVDDAPALIAQTRSATGRERDLAVLAAAKILLAR